MRGCIYCALSRNRDGVLIPGLQSEVRGRPAGLAIFAGRHDTAQDAVA